jgi:hypothetical protein
MRRRTLSLILVALLAAAVFGACASGSAPKASTANSASGSASKGVDSAAPAAAPQGNSAPGQISSAPAPIDERKIVRNASFDLRIKDADETITRISQAVTASGGYVQETKQTGTKQNGRTVNMIVRVPSGQYSPLVELIRGLGEVAQQREWTEDVTEQFIDLDQRIKSQEIHLAQLEKLYAQGGSIQDMMQLETEIARVTADVESMKGKLRVLSSRVDFSTITMNLAEQGAPLPMQPPKTVWERMSRGFLESWHSVVNFTGDLLVFVVSALPVLAYLAVIGLVIALIVRALQKVAARRRPKGPPSMMPPAGPSTQYHPAPPLLPEDPNQPPKP